MSLRSYCSGSSIAGGQGSRTAVGGLGTIGFGRVCRVPPCETPAAVGCALLMGGWVAGAPHTTHTYGAAALRALHPGSSTGIHTLQAAGGPVLLFLNSTCIHTVLSNLWPVARVSTTRIVTMHARGPPVLRSTTLDAGKSSQQRLQV